MSADPRPVVMFDFDGTLADTWRDIATALNRTLDDAGLEAVTGPEVRFWIGDGALKLLERAIPEERRTVAYVNELYESFRRHYDLCCLDTTETYGGMIECLNALADTTLAIVSNKPARFLERVIEGLALKDYFRVVLAGDTLGYQKPNPVVVEHVLERIGCKPDSIWMVGDSAIDVQTGKSAHARTVGCTWGFRGREELREAGADHLVDTPREIPPLIKRSV